MAKKKQAVEQVDPVKQAGVPVVFEVPYEALIAARVQVVDAAGNQMYLDPARKQGEFVLRVVPQTEAPVAEELPAEWVRPAKEDGVPAAIDWGLETPPQPSPEGEEAEADEDAAE